MKKHAFSLPAFLVSLLLVLALLFAASRIWLSGAAGCARAIGSAVYSDEDDPARQEPDAIAQTDAGLTDAAYDAVFPGLVEPAPEAE